MHWRSSWHCHAIFDSMYGDILPHKSRIRCGDCGSYIAIPFHTSMRGFLWCHWQHNKRLRRPFSENSSILFTRLNAVMLGIMYSYLYECNIIGSQITLLQIPTMMKNSKAQTGWLTASCRQKLLIWFPNTCMQLEATRDGHWNQRCNLVPFPNSDELIFTTRQYLYITQKPIPAASSVLLYGRRKSTCGVLESCSLVTARLPGIFRQTPPWAARQSSSCQAWLLLWFRDQNTTPARWECIESNLAPMPHQLARVSSSHLHVELGNARPAPLDMAMACK